MLCNTELRAQLVLSAVRSSKVVVLDVETSGLSYWNSHIVGWVLTVGPSTSDTFYVPVRHAGGGNLPGCTVPDKCDNWDGTLHWFEVELAKVLAAPRTVVAHNLQFDLWFARRHGVVPSGPFVDTMVTQSLINEHQSSMSLDACCSAQGVIAKKGLGLYQYLASQFGGEAVPNQMAHYWETNASIPIVHEYAAGDGTSTWELYESQLDTIANSGDNGLQNVYGVECRVLPAVHSMIWRGIRVDEERLYQVEQIVKRRLERSIGKFAPDFNPRSPLQMKKLFIDAGITDYPVTDKGNASFTEEWLMQSELGRTVVDVRKYSTLLSSFIDPLKNKHLHNGRVHPWYNQSRDEFRGTVTGRFSSSGPNQQQIPKRNKQLGKLFRSIYVPDEGKIWASVDYSQCEPTLLAHYLSVSGWPDNALSLGYKADPPVDSHTAVANAAGIDRDSAKRLNQACITGAGKNKVVEELMKKGRTHAEASLIHAKYFEGLPGIRPLQNLMSNTMKTRGYIRTLLGRRCRMDSDGMSYKAMNRVLQGGNADIIKLKMAEVYEYLESVNSSVEVLASIHDSLDYQFEEDDRHHYDRCIEIMTSFGPEDKISLSLPLRVDAGEGTNWAIASYGDDFVED